MASEPTDLGIEETAVDGAGELAAESTQILQAKTAMPLLVVESGRDLGREFVVVEGETSVGRGIDNEVILADVSVSRRHLSIQRDGGSFTLRDLGSGNGTMVNGHRVRNVVLSQGDRIELGETVLVLRLPTGDRQLLAAAVESSTEETVAPREDVSTLTGWDGPLRSPPGDLTRLPRNDERTGGVSLRSGSVLAAATAAALGVAVLAGASAAFLANAPSEPVASSLPAETAAPHMPDALRVREGSSSPPRTFSEPEETPALPAVAFVNPEVPSGAPLATQEGGSDDAGRIETANETRASARQSADRAFPDRTAGSVSPEAHARRDEAASATRSVRAPLPRRATAAATVRSSTILAAYRRGDFGRAAALARSAGEAELAEKIAQFEGEYRAAQSGRTSAMGRAIAIDSEIAGGRGHFGPTLRATLAEATVAEARTLMTTQPQEACQRVQRALGVDPGNGAARALARECERRAQLLVEDAIALESTRPGDAQRAYRGILLMVPRTSRSYQQSRQRLGLLARRRRVDEDE